MADPAVEVVASLAHLGFSEAEAIAYVRLLRGASSAHDLTPPLRPTEARKCLAGLLDRGLVGKAKGRGQYYAVDPEVAWQATIADLVWSRDLSLAPVWQLPTSPDGAVNRARAVLDDIRRNAALLYVPRSDLPEHDREFVLQHPAKIEQATVEAISGAASGICAVSRTPRWPRVAPIWTAISARLAEGASYQRIADLPELVDHGLAVVRRDVFVTGVQLRFIETSTLDCTFYMVDGKIIVVRREEDRATVSRRQSTLRAFEARFASWWQRSVPAEVVLPRYQSAAIALVERARDELGQEGGELLDALVRYGRFALIDEDQGWTPERAQPLVADAVRRGLVRISEVGQPVPVYGLAEEVLAELRAETGAEREAAPCLTCFQPTVHCRC